MLLDATGWPPARGALATEAPSLLEDRDLVAYGSVGVGGRARHLESGRERCTASADDGDSDNSGIRMFGHRFGGDRRKARDYSRGTHAVRATRSIEILANDAVKLQRHLRAVDACRRLKSTFHISGKHARGDCRRRLCAERIRLRRVKT